MKKILALLLALTMILALAACGQQTASSSAPAAAPADAELVGVAMPTKDLQRWNQDGENMKNLLEAAGYEVDLQFGANDIAPQVSQIENMIANGCKVLVIASIDGDSLSAVLNRPATYHRESVRTGCMGLLCAVILKPFALSEYHHIVAPPLQCFYSFRC